MLEDLDFYLMGFKVLALPAMALAAVLLWGFWYGLLVWVPATLPQPLPPLIIWSVMGVLMFFAYGVSYTRERQAKN